MTEIVNVPVGVALESVLMVRSELVPPPPGTGLAGLKTQVESAGIPEQDRPTGLLKAPPSGVRVTVKFTEDPRWTDALDGDTEIAKSTPVPVRLTVCGLSGALSLNVSVPVLVPNTVGEKATLTAQLAPGAMDVPQLFVWLKSPLVVIAETLIAKSPVFVSVTCCPALTD